MAALSFKYKPSLINRFTSWVQTLPYSPWLVYSVIGIGLLIYSVSSRFLAGIYPTQLSARVIYELFSSSILISVLLAIHYYFDKEIEEALHAVRPSAFQKDEEFRKTSYSFLNMNNWYYLAAFLTTAFPGARNLVLLLGLRPITIADFPLLFELWFASGLFGGLTFYLGHLLVRTLQFYSKKIKLNIFNLGTIYELPASGAKLALVVLAIFYLNVPLNVNEEILFSPSTLFLGAIISVLPLLALLLPYTAINRRLQREKKTEIAAISVQIQDVFTKLEKQVKAGKFSENISLKATIESLKIKKEYIENIPTWPWRTGVFRVTFSAILFPIVVYIIQQLLDRYVIK